tara:strand:+ start:439 stop:2928 length:2490 start_codon:yes stop_codon:yes gene_type:complete
MRGAKKSDWTTAVGLFAILLLSLFGPQVAASGGSATIDVASISLSMAEQTDSNTVNYFFDVVEQGGLSAEVTAHSTLKTIGGSVLASSNESKTIGVSGTETFTVMFDVLPFGYSIIETTLSGDVGQESSTNVVSFNRTIQRLVPLSIGLATSGSMSFTSLDGTGNETGNISVSDGDRLGLLIPVLNNGDYPWSGSMTIQLTAGAYNESVNITGIAVDGMSSTLVQWNSSISMAEGATELTVALNNSGDADQSDESRSFQLTIAPPPLPELDLQLLLATEDYVAGDVLDWNLSVTNNGSSSFSGQITCTFGLTTALNQSLDVAISTSSTLQFTTQARPDDLVCNASGMRLSVASNSPVTVVFDLVSAVFEAAGSSTPGVLDGPWHVGDSARFSMLVRNHGDIEGSVALECSTTQTTYTSSLLSLAVDAAGEVAVTVPMLEEGDQVVSWRLFSPDGSIDDGLNGTLVVPVSPKQVLSPSVGLVTWDAEIGVSMSWSVTLGEGVDRSVRLRLGYFESGETYLLDYDVLLAPGVTNGTFDLGFIEADRVTLRVDAINWSEALGPSSDSKSIPDDRPVYSANFDPLASPSRPGAGQSATVQIQIANTGDVAGTSGELLLLGEDNTLYGTKTTEPLGAGESTTLTFNLDWPQGTRVKLQAIWSIDGNQILASNSFTSADVEVEEEAFSIPWVGLLGGVALAGAVLAAVRIKQGQSLGPSSKKSSTKTKSKPTSTAKHSDIKIQVGCPECARQLRVPESYSGSVRCPDCSNRFEVEAKNTASEESDVEQPEEEEVELVEEKIEVSCPECDQSLRVPSSYDGSVRCPACEFVFTAKG